MHVCHIIMHICHIIIHICHVIIVSDSRGPVLSNYTRGGTHQDRHTTQTARVLSSIFPLVSLRSFALLCHIIIHIRSAHTHWTLGSVVSMNPDVSGNSPILTTVTFRTPAKFAARRQGRVVRISTVVRISEHVDCRGSA